jgi:hypothetical protein
MMLSDIPRIKTATAWGKKETVEILDLELVVHIVTIVI